MYKNKITNFTAGSRWGIIDYLNNRKTEGSIAGGIFSHWSDLKAGVLQGSILGPLLFLIYINYIVRNINSSIRLYTDDTSLYIIVEHSIQSATVLNSDLSQINTWASNWFVTLNPSKTESVLFSQNLLNHLIQPFT